MEQKMKVCIWDIRNTRLKSMGPALEQVLGKENVTYGTNISEYHDLEKTFKYQQIEFALIHLGNLSDYNQTVRIVNQLNREFPNVLVVLYTGAPVEIKNEFRADLTVSVYENEYVFSLNNADTVCVIPRPVSESSPVVDLNIVPALQEYDQTKSKIEFFNTLCRIDPILEAKLELLHMCLTPGGANDVLNGKFPAQLKSAKDTFWNSKLLELNPTLLLQNSKLKEFTHISETQPKKNHEEWTIEHLIRILATHFKSDSFLEIEYLTVLANLRDALL